jgi:hypothetical protein
LTHGLERIELDFTPMWLEGEGDNELLVIGTEVCQAEIELGGEQIELRPGGRHEGSSLHSWD